MLSWALTTLDVCLHVSLVNEFPQVSILSPYLFSLKFILNYLTIRILTVSSMERMCLHIFLSSVTNTASSYFSTAWNILLPKWSTAISVWVYKMNSFSFLQFLGTSSGYPNSVNVLVFSSWKPNFSDNISFPFLLILSPGHWLFLVMLDSVSFCLYCPWLRILSLIGLIQQSPKTASCFVVLLAQIHPAHKSQS